MHLSAPGVKLRLELLVCDRSVSVNVITHRFVGLKCLTETKIQILHDHVDHARFHIVEMGCQMVQLLSAHIVGPTMFVNLTSALLIINSLSVKEPPTFVFQLNTFIHLNSCKQCTAA